MATKQTASPRDRRIFNSSPLHHSSASHLQGLTLKTSLSGGVHTTPPEKKVVPNHLKPKTAASSEASHRRTSTATIAAATSATGKAPFSRTLAEKSQLPSNTTTLQRQLKPSSHIPKPSSSSRINGDKTTQTVIRSDRAVPIPKAKSSSGNIKKKEIPTIIADHSQPKLSSDHEVTIAIEKPVRKLLQSDCDKVIESLNVTNIEEDIKPISSPIGEENQMEKLKGEEEVEESGVFAEIPKQPVVFEKVPKQVDVQTLMVDARRVELEVKKSRLAVASFPAETPATKKKEAQRRSNDMIEETKSKLMGSRRNKVLALVGAFETVISLQETEGQLTQKPSQIQQFLQIQQDEQSPENHTDLLCNVNQKEQGVEEVRSFHQLEEIDKQCQENGKHLVNGEEEDEVIVEEEISNELLESGEKGEVERLKEEGVGGSGNQRAGRRG